MAEELADVFIYLCSLANIHGIDLEQAFREKEERKKERKKEKTNNELGRDYKGLTT